MSKMGRMLVVVMAVMVQVVLGVLYGFSGLSIPAWGCFAVWCVCAVMIDYMMGFSKGN